MTQDSRLAGADANFPWPLTFDSFSFGTRVCNTLRCSIIFERHQFALSDELDQPSGAPSDPNWEEEWSAGFNIFRDMMPPEPVEIQWISLDGIEHNVEIDLIKDIFPEQVVLHNVLKENVNKEWARYEGGKTSSPDILMEVNDRTISIYMKAHVLTKLPPNPERPDILGCWDSVLAWTKTY